VDRARAIVVGVGVVLFALGFGAGWLARGSGGIAVSEEPVAQAGAMSSGPAGDASARSRATSREPGDAAIAGRSAHEAAAQDHVASGAEAGEPERALPGSAAHGAPGSGAEAGSLDPAGDGGVPRGRLSPRVIQDEVRSHRDELGFCFAWQLHQHPEMRGRLTMEFTIGQDGSVTAADVVEDELGDETVARCFRSVTERMQFPAPEGGSVVVRYPFVLSPDEAPSPGEHR
jgi:hypothetical protein